MQLFSPHSISRHLGRRGVPSTTFPVCISILFHENPPQEYFGSRQMASSWLGNPGWSLVGWIQMGIWNLQRVLIFLVSDWHRKCCLIFSAVVWRPVEWFRYWNLLSKLLTAWLLDYWYWIFIINIWSIFQCHPFSDIFPYLKLITW